MEEGRCPVTGLKSGEKMGFFMRIYFKLFHRKASYN